MSIMPSRPGTVRTSAYVSLALVVAGVGLLAIVGGIGETLDAGPAGWLPGMVAVVVLPALVWRIAGFSVVVTDETVEVRNLLRTYRLRRQEVSDVQAVEYSGLWNRCSHSSGILTIRVCTGERDVTAFGLLGRRSTMSRIEADLRLLIGMPAIPDSKHDHDEP